ncbi:hypothetical protein MRB53_006025 [Persea americana]|uniref:Uncharacterized protein n=1 Tax=Persea americana TaxID=3435 RepID=A0ACC2MET2_PERAE|nr:hypothetical protein MRB53_006025 [Persea americana]
MQKLELNRVPNRWRSIPWGSSFGWTKVSGSRFPGGLRDWIGSRFPTKVTILDSPRAVNPLLYGFQGGRLPTNLLMAEKEKDSLLLLTMCWGILIVSLPSFQTGGGKAREEDMAVEVLMQKLELNRVPNRWRSIPWKRSSGWAKVRGSRLPGGFDGLDREKIPY